MHKLHSTVLPSDGRLVSPSGNNTQQTHKEECLKFLTWRDALCRWELPASVKHQTC